MYCDVVLAVYIIIIIICVYIIITAGKLHVFGEPCVCQSIVLQNMFLFLFPFHDGSYILSETETMVSDNRKTKSFKLTMLNL